MDLFTVDVLSTFQESIKLPFYVKYNVQSLLKPEDCLLDFGIRDARDKHVRMIIVILSMY